jgi:hypothetical protein
MRQSLAVRWLLLFALSLVAVVVLIPAAGCNASCKPMEANGNPMQCAGGARGYIWTGTSCIYTALCNCTGPDCQRLYSTQDGCETAHLGCR